MGTVIKEIKLYMITTVISMDGIQGVSPELPHHESNRIIFLLSYACIFADLTMFWTVLISLEKLKIKETFVVKNVAWGEGWTPRSDFWTIRSRFHKLDSDLRVEKGNYMQLYQYKS